MVMVMVTTCDHVDNGRGPNSVVMTRHLMDGECFLTFGDIYIYISQTMEVI